MSSKATKRIRPLSDRIIVEPKELETTSAGGIVIPDTASDREKPMEGTVYAVGTGRYIDGKLQPLQVKEGQQVLFGKYAGTNIKLEGKEYLVLREEDVMGVLE
ncbi:MAG: co-chaperone GroES [Gammaproteobacteria bacterium]|nr:co-chaperone GroES [Gammaproteobacteria bacterium]